MYTLYKVNNKVNKALLDYYYDAISRVNISTASIDDIQSLIGIIKFYGVPADEISRRLLHRDYSDLFRGASWLAICKIDEIIRIQSLDRIELLMQLQLADI